MESSVKCLVHGWWAADPNLLDLIDVEFSKLLEDKILIPSLRILAFLGKSNEQVKVISTIPVTIISKRLEEF